MDGFDEQFKPILQDATIAFLLRSKAQLTPLPNGWMPLDCDVTPFDNSHTNKEGVSCTYNGVDGYAPMAAYLGQEGYGLELELRADSQHARTAHRSSSSGCWSGHDK